jgi:tetratricopeptide (TPR) repeat protein
MAYSGLADTYGALGAYSLASTKDSTPKAKAYALKALQIDDSLAEAHASLGSIMQAYDWDIAGAEREFKRAIELNPSYASAHHWYSGLLSVTERHDEALSRIRLAETLDPLSLIIGTEVGVFLYRAGHYEEAIQQYRKIITLDPKFWRVHGELAFALAELGRYDEAIAELKIVRSLFDHSNVDAALGYVYAKAGRTAEAHDTLAALETRANKEYVSSYWVARVYAALGEKDKAFAQLEKAFNERSEWILLLKSDPCMTTLRADPRFSDLINRIGFQY